MVAFLVICLAAAGHHRALAVQTDSTHVRFVLNLIDTVKKIKKAEPEKNVLLSPDEIKQNDALAQALSQMLAVQDISTYALMHHWEKLSDKDRNQ